VVRGSLVEAKMLMMAAIALINTAYIEFTITFVTALRAVIALCPSSFKQCFSAPCFRSVILNELR